MEPALLNAPDLVAMEDAWLDVPVLIDRMAGGFRATASAKERHGQLAVWTACVDHEPASLLLCPLRGVVDRSINPSPFSRIKKMRVLKKATIGGGG